jgi:hypothetical protein
MTRLTGLRRGAVTGLLAVGFLLTGCGGPAATPSPTVAGGDSTPAPTTCPAFVEPGCSSRPGLCRVLWTRRLTYIAYAGFTTPDQGVAITGPGTLLMTYDGGHTWAAVDI